MQALQIDIYENDSRTAVVTHVFRGETRKVVNATVSAHMRFDSFFCAAMSRKTFYGMTLTTRRKWLT